METGLLKKNDVLLSVQGADCSSADLDAVMALLADAPEEVELLVARNVIVKEQRKVVPPPRLTIASQKKGELSGEVTKGVILRTAVLKSGAELYKGMDKMTNCGGVGQCNSCAISVLEGDESLSPRTEVEEKRLKSKPPSYRLACQAFVNGDVKVEVPGL